MTYTLTGVTVPSLGETKKVYFQINFTDGTTQVGNNKFDVTNNYSAASVKAAVEAALSSKTAAAASYGLDTLAAYVSNQIKTVSGVTDVKVTPNGQPSSWTVDTMVYYNYEYTYGGETYTGSTYFKLTLDRVLKASLLSNFYTPQGLSLGGFPFFSGKRYSGRPACRRGRGRSCPRPGCGSRCW